MNKRYLPMLVFAALMSFTANAQRQNAKGLTGYAAEAASASQTLVQRVDTWGDWFGAAPSVPMPTNVCYYYYDNANRLYATMKVTKMAGDSGTTVEVEKEGDEIPTTYTTYTYDEKGQMVKATERVYGSYDGIFLGWAPTSTVTESNQYDDAGHLVYQYTSKDSHLNTWEGNNLVEQSDSAQSLGATAAAHQWSKTTQYADFVEGKDNLPQTANSVDRWKQMQQVKNVYDEQGRMTSSTVWKVKSADVDADHHLTNIVLNANPYSKQEWTYDEDGNVKETVSSFWSNSTSSFAPSQKTTFTVNADGSRVEQSYTWNVVSNSWSLFGGDDVTYYADYTEGTAPVDLKAALSDTEKNTVTLTATVPASVADVQTWQVYRDGRVVGNAEVTDGVLTYVDQHLKNGSYSYFVQGVKDGKELNVSNTVSAECSTELPAPQNLHIVSKELIDGSNGKQWKVTVAWDAPEAQDGLVMRGYNLYSDISYADTNPRPDNFNSETENRKEELVENTTYTYTWAADLEACHTIYVEAVYENLGRVKALPVAMKLGNTAEKLLQERAMVGDAMGDVETEETKREDYYYNEKNLLVRVVNRAALLGDDPNTPEKEKKGDWSVTAYTMYNYDKNDNLINVSKQERKVLQGYKVGWTAVDTLNAYKYDAQNRCIENRQTGYKMNLYTWDDQNNLVKDVQMNTYSNTVIYEMQYSNFVEGKVNLPQTAIKDGSLTSNQRVIEMTYDADGHMLSRMTYKYADDVVRDAEGHVVSVSKGTPELEETWSYDEEGDMTLYLKRKWKNDAFVDANKTVYTKHVGYTYEEPFTYSTVQGEGFWSPGRPYINRYMEYYKGVAPTAFKATVSKDKVNTVTFTANMPTDKWDSPVYYVYRNGVLMGQAEISPRRTTVSFTDEFVPNGTWDYYLEPNTQTANVGMSIPTPINLTFNTELPSVTNVHVASATSDDDNHHLQLAWDAPELGENGEKGLKLLGYNYFANVYNDNRLPAPENVGKYITEPEYEYSWTVLAGTEAKAMLEVVYNIGSIFTDNYSFDMKKLTGVKDAAAAADAALSVSGRTVKVNGSYKKLSVYAVSGALCSEHVGESTVSLSTLPQGVYVVKLQKADGQTEAQKVVLK